jgi:hypothetical protein
MTATNSLFDNFVGESEFIRNLQAERRGSPQVYDEIFASDPNRAYLPRSGSLRRTFGFCPEVRLSPLKSNETDLR